MNVCREICSELLTIARLNVQTRLINQRTRRTIRRNDRMAQQAGIPLPPCQVFMDLMRDYPTLELEMRNVVKDDTAKTDGRLFDLIAKVNRLAAERQS